MSVDLPITMATDSRKTRSGRSQFQMDVHFVNDKEKEVFKYRLKRICQHLMPQGRADIDNLGLISAMFEMVERDH